MSPLQKQLLIEQEVAPFREVATRAYMMGCMPRVILCGDGTSTVEQAWANEQWKSVYDRSNEFISLIHQQYTKDDPICPTSMPNC